MRAGSSISKLVLLGACAAAACLPSAATASGGGRTAAEFFARISGKTVTCAMYDGRGGRSTLCETVRPGFEAKATLEPSGTVKACSVKASTLANRCDLGNAGVGTPTYRSGRTVTVGRFRCQVLSGGVRCVVTKTGRGFMFTPSKITGVGGASVRRTVG
ncbi:MAG TPA: hypothetical protein VMB91_03260 [Solirubrobacteraceae bacterium]|nr:hypothetical protein [Solirubrobacteraceae bacterium]